MPNKNSEAFELSLKQFLKNDIDHAYREYEYLIQSQNNFRNKKLNNFLGILADVQIELYKTLSDKFYNQYGVYPQNDKP